MKIYSKDKYIILSFFKIISDNGEIDKKIIKKISDNYKNEVGIDGKKGGFGNDKGMIESFLKTKYQNYENIDDDQINIYFNGNWSSVVKKLIKDGFLQKTPNTMLYNEVNSRFILTDDGELFLKNYKNIFRKIEITASDYPVITTALSTFVIGLIIGILVG